MRRRHPNPPHRPRLLKSPSLQGDEASPPATAAPPAQERTFEINAYDVEGNTLLDQLAVETAVYPHLGPGRTPADVEAARAALEKAYQAHGYQSVIVQVPAQNAASGIVRLRVTEARVGHVRVSGSEYHLPSVVREQMPSLQEGQVPDFRAVQRDLADVNRLPDRRVTPSLKPGRIPGTVDVDLHVNDDLPLHASVEVNNDHSQNTKPLRTLATVHYDNLWQLGHSLSATYSVAPQQPSNSEVFARFLSRAALGHAVEPARLWLHVEQRGRRAWRHERARQGPHHRPARHLSAAELGRRDPVDQFRHRLQAFRPKPDAWADQP